MNQKMTYGEKEHTSQRALHRISKMIFYICAFYFFLMGASLIFIPDLILKGITNGEASQTITGMLRGAGGSILPYSLLYIMIARDQNKRRWALNVILAANIIAIILDLLSVTLSEYKLSNAMIDLPFEILSMAGIVMAFRGARTNDGGGC